MEKGQENMRGEIYFLKGMMGKILETLQVLMNKEDQSHLNTHTDNGTPSRFSAGPQQIQGENVQLLTFCLPPNYTPPFANATNGGPFIQQLVQILVVTKLCMVRFLIH